MKVMRAIQLLACVAIIGLFFVSANRVEAQSTTVRIVSVECVKATLGSDTDEIYFSFLERANGKLTSTTKFPKRGNRRIKKGQTWKPNQLFTFGHGSSGELRLDESDLLNLGIEGIASDDLIGRVTITPSDAPGQRTLVWTRDSSHYIVKLDIR